MHPFSLSKTAPSSYLSVSVSLCISLPSKAKTESGKADKLNITARRMLTKVLVVFFIVKHPFIIIFAEIK